MCSLSFRLPRCGSTIDRTHFLSDIQFIVKRDYIKLNLKKIAIFIVALCQFFFVIEGCWIDSQSINVLPQAHLSKRKQKGVTNGQTK